MSFRSARALLLAGVLATGGCTAGESLDGLYTDALAPTSGPVPAAEAWAALPPAAGAVVSVVETRTPRSDRQRIVLLGDGAHAGENAITVERGGSEGVRSDLLHPPSIETLSGEIAKLERGSAYRILSSTDANRAGPFGYATLTEQDGSCIYAWQWLDERELGGERTLGLGRSHPVSVRVRLCRKASVAVLLAQLRDLELSFGRRHDQEISLAAGGSGQDALSSAANGAGVHLPAPPASSEAERVTLEASAEAVADPERRHSDRPRARVRTATAPDVTASNTPKAGTTGHPASASDGVSTEPSPHIPSPTDL